MMAVSLMSGGQGTYRRAGLSLEPALALVCGTETAAFGAVQFALRRGLRRVLRALDRPRTHLTRDDNIPEEAFADAFVDFGDIVKSCG